MEKELIKELSVYEQQFRWAINSNFLRMSTGEFNEIARLYKAVFNTSLTLTQMTCNTCRLKAMKALGEAYFNALKEEEEKKEKESESEGETEEAEKITEEAPKKKAGRPRKIKMDE